MDIDDINISALFFADDIVLITKSPSNMRRLLGIVTNWSIAWKMDISLTKSKFMTHPAGENEIPMMDTKNNSMGAIKEVPFFKYLGVNVEIAPWQLYRRFNDHVISKARKYMYAIMSLAKEGPDRSEIARALWLNCALPSILYGVECNILTKGTVDTLERLQSRVGKFILQLPMVSTNVTSNIDAGLLPMKYHILSKQLNYQQRLLTLPKWWWVRKAYKEQVKMGMASKYIRKMMMIKTEQNVLNLNKKCIKKRLLINAKEDTLLEAKKCKKSTILMLDNAPNFKIKSWVNDSSLSQILSLFRGSDAGLGNRAPLADGLKVKFAYYVKEVNQHLY